jgi:hypothetical protein
LPNVKPKILGKDLLCRVPKKTFGKDLCRVPKKTLGKELVCLAECFFWHSTKSFFVECQKIALGKPSSTRQRAGFW